MATDAQLDNFEQAFLQATTKRTRCECGKVYFDVHNTGYDWGEGALESLLDDPNAHACDHAIGRIAYDGRLYANACACWVNEADRFVQWVEANGQAVANYLRYEKQRKIIESTNSPVVEDD